MKNVQVQKPPCSIQLVTACCYGSNTLLREDRYKQYVLEGLNYMVQQQRIWLYGYVLLEDEFHAMWRQRAPWETRNIRQHLLRHIAHRIRCDMWANNPQELEHYRSRLADRKYQFWEKAKLRVEIANIQTAADILENMHDAPVRAGLCQDRSAYPYSSGWHQNESAAPLGLTVPPLSDIADAFNDQHTQEAPQGKGLQVAGLRRGKTVKCPQEHWDRFTKKEGK